MSEQRIRVLVVDDHFIVRKGLESLLVGCDDIVVVGEACDGREAVDKALETRPNVVLMDLLMPQMNGVEAIRSIALAAPDIRVLVLSGSATVKETLAAVRAGALGYLSKDCERDHLVGAIRRLHRGELSLPADLTRLLMQQFEGPSTEAESLTPRERDVLKLLAQGRDDSEVARSLGISKATVRTHVSNLLAKLSLRNRVEATLYALRQGLTTLEGIPHTDAG